MVWDTEGRRYLDGSGGAVVVNVGHGREEIAAAMARQAAAAGYVHGTQFTSDVLEEYARRLAAHAPGDCRRLYLVSGGSEANETAVKLARAYHLARGEPARHKVIGRSVSYHGNTLAALSLSGRPTLQAPYRAAAVRRAARRPRPSATTARSSATYPACALACADDLEAVDRARRAGDRSPPSSRSRSWAPPRGRPCRPTTTRAARARPADRHGDRLHRRRGHDRLRPHRPLVRRSSGAAPSPTSSPAARG